MKKFLGIVVLGLCLILLNSCASYEPNYWNDWYEKTAKKMAQQHGFNYHVVVHSYTRNLPEMTSYSNFEDAEKTGLKSCKKLGFTDCYVYLRLYVAYDPNTGRYSYKKPEKKITKKSDKKQDKKPETTSGTDKPVSVASGTGFFISRTGHIVSNNHVIDSCNTVKVHYKGKVSTVTILATDYANDLSLMKSDLKPEDALAISSDDATLLEDIYVAGFPFGKMVSSSVKVTKGVVSALTGIGNNYSNMQIDAALQPGNSGGPIIDKKGNVVGVAVSKLDYKKVIKDFGTIPEATNFGIKSSTVHQFIKANNVKSIQESSRGLSNEMLGKKIENTTIYLDCWMTAKRVEELRSRRAFFKGIE